LTKKPAEIRVPDPGAGRGAGDAPPALVPAELDRRALDAVVRALFSLSWNEARDRIRGGKVTVNGATRADPLFRVRQGAEVALRMRAPRAGRERLPDSAVVDVDAHLVVVDKPAGISTVPYEPDDKGTLEELVRAWLSTHAARDDRERRLRPALGVVHRLDKETSGLIVFTRSWLAKKSLASQFRSHSVVRRYLAIANGKVASTTIRSRLVQNRGDGLRGSLRGGGKRAEEGQLAITHVEALEPLDGATLIACELETGRTHQIRIHLSESGHPIVGERVYVRGLDQPLVPAPRLMLHAAKLGFVHPKTGESLEWERPAPGDFEETLGRLRRGR
jgi:23S rRNA pseudouridine1911/1915/1917 synthase